MHNRQNRPIFLVSTIALILGFASAAGEAAADPPTPPDQPEGRSYQVAVDRAINFLRTKGQEADGSYAGTEVLVDEEELLIMDEHEILAVVT